MRTFLSLSHNIGVANPRLASHTRIFARIQAALFTNLNSRISNFLVPESLRYGKVWQWKVTPGLTDYV